ncbi:MAG: sulfatase [Gemmatimonadetes bacterium]|nr:sulfatase [Gemmatimonadota bacterium]
MAPLADAILFVASVATLAVILRVAHRSYRVLDGSSRLLVSFLACWTLTLQFRQLHPLAALALALGAATQLSVALGSEVMRRVVQQTLAPLSLAVAFLAVGMLLVPSLIERRAAAALGPVRGTHNVLLLILDTVRAQSLGLYGNKRPISPTLDSIGAAGIVFDRAISTAPWTVPSHASMLTGKYPHELTVDWLTPLDDTTPTLAAAMARKGFATGGFVANYILSREVRLARGFMHYEDYSFSFPQVAHASAIYRRIAYWPRLRHLLGKYDSANRKDASQVNKELLQWVTARGDRPFFAFVNYFDAHEMYNPPPPFRGMLGTDSIRRNDLTRYGLEGVAHRSAKTRMSPVEADAERNAYEESIAYLDSQIGALMHSLNALGVLKNTVVVISSDHGEHFGERGRWEHASSLYPQLLHVPLIIAGTGAMPKGLRVESFVTLRDVAATIESIGSGEEGLPGQSLERFWAPKRREGEGQASLLLSSYTNPSWSADASASVTRGTRSVVADDLLVIETVRGPASIEVEAFDLWQDPGATNEVSRDTSARKRIDAARADLRGLTWASQRPGVSRKAGNVLTP